MYAQRLDHEHDHDHGHDESEPASGLDLSRGPDNDNAHSGSPDGDAALSIEGIVPRGPSRRVRDVLIAVFATLSLSAFAFTRHPSAPQHEAPPPVTQVDIAARATPVAESSEPVLVVPDAPSRHRSHEPAARHEGHVASTSEAPTNEAIAPASEPATTRTAPTHEEPLARLVTREEPLARLVTREEAAAAQARASEPATREPPTNEAASSDETERDEALPTDSADEVVEAAVRAHSSEVDECINDAPDEAAGRLTVQLVIGRDGAVRSATPHGPEPLHSVGQCIARAMRGWRMVVPDATGDTTISWPFEVESNQ